MFPSQRKPVHGKWEMSQFTKKVQLGLPWWLSGEESIGYIPGPGKTPHGKEQVTPWASTTDRACALEAGSRDYWAHTP